MGVNIQGDAGGGMPHPELGRLQIDTGFPQQGAVGVTEIVCMEFDAGPGDHVIQDCIDLGTGDRSVRKHKSRAVLAFEGGEQLRHQGDGTHTGRSLGGGRDEVTGGGGVSASDSQGAGGKIDVTVNIHIDGLHDAETGIEHQQDKQAVVVMKGCVSDSGNLFTREASMHGGGPELGLYQAKRRIAEQEAVLYSGPEDAANKGPIPRG